jgi:DNA-binding protein HU-beta
MTKAELIDAVHETVGLPGVTKKTTGELVDTLFGVLKENIAQDGRFSFPGFGTFTVKERAARTGRNPRTNETIQIPGGKTVGFKPAPAFKDAL